jgi:predicted PurR-regulated permease PerM
VIVLIGVLGGIQIYGLVGIMIGPVLLAVFIKFIELLEIERKSL